MHPKNPNVDNNAANAVLCSGMKKLRRRNPCKDFFSEVFYSLR
ncbi:Uncharacterised protein [Porphyromonas crevioricanis]|uniref:Uncharacterized protein n=1 Tax=Porphyromonas crevioricanis TaxID=393921 RepID=A0A2X4Q007_9PORP|nr:hypothetical protein PORCAN_1823 [Porphyromonas crevioricanis JCM 13913]SJZ66230.1 hypothetical protein SAMN02745203_00468 [Porphyromonas crevioricanis]SQH73929.1 Uncharacterised protein [Porphyromonas crevioricanis]